MFGVWRDSRRATGVGGSDYRMHPRRQSQAFHPKLSAASDFRKERLRNLNALAAKGTIYRHASVATTI
jgi:hypothetical protein